jgi:hypothetical protein
MATTVNGGYESSTKRSVTFGVTAFAGVMLTTLAVFQILQGIAAVAKDKVYVKGIDYTYQFDITQWGWIHIVVGAAGVAIGLGILAGQTWGRIAGIAVAVVAALTNFAFLPYYPLWSIVIIAFSAFVIWALCTQMSHRDRGI